MIHSYMRRANGRLLCTVSVLCAARRLNNRPQVDNSIAADKQAGLKRRARNSRTAGRPIANRPQVDNLPHIFTIIARDVSVRSGAGGGGSSAAIDRGCASELANHSGNLRRRDGLKWFNGIYLDVTQAVKAHIARGGFNDPAWLVELDVQFATLYFGALGAGLLARGAAGCRRALFDRRNRTKIARIQFALAGANAHVT